MTVGEIVVDVLFILLMMIMTNYNKKKIRKKLKNGTQEEFVSLVDSSL